MAANEATRARERQRVAQELLHQANITENARNAGLEAAELIEALRQLPPPIVLEGNEARLPANTEGFGEVFQEGRTPSNRHAQPTVNLERRREPD